MENRDNRLSQGIKEKLEGYEKTPPSYLWQKIEAGLDEVAADRNTKTLYFLQKNWQVIAAVAAALLILLFVLSYGSDTGMMPQSPLAPDNRIVNKTPTPAVNEIKAGTESAKAPNKRIEKQQEQFGSGKINNNSQETKNSNHYISFSKLSKKDCPALESSNDALAYNHPELKTEYQNQNNLVSTRKNEATVTNNHPDFPKVLANNNWAFGVYATPERMFNPGKINGNSSAFSADVAIMYSFNKYFIQSGFSMGTSSDNSNANIDFIETELLGTYQDVYNVTFDTTGGEPKPIYHTQEVEVYDTAEYQTTTAYTNSYRYLSMPLLMGHKNTLSRNLAYSVKGGPVVSFMLNETANHNFNNQNAQIQSIYNKPAGRVTTNWQFIFSAGLHYHLHNDIWLAIEPRVKYYFNPVYNSASGPNNKNPFALGVSTGLTVGF